MRGPRDAVRVGVLLASAGAVGYGVTVVIGRSLATEGLDSATALGARFGLAALMLLGLAVALRLPLRPPPGERLTIVLLGGIGYTTESTLFYLALEQGTAAAAILLFYAYPAMVAAIEMARDKERPGPATLGALALSSAGTVAVVAARGDVSISTAGVVFALSSAAVYAVYLVVGRELGRRTHPVTTAAWVAIGACGSSLARGLLGGGLADPRPYAAEMALYGAATAAAFALTFAALHRIGPARTAVISTLEAFSAIVLGAAFLGERITGVQTLGGAAIIAAAAVIASTGSAAGGSEAGGKPTGIHRSVDVPSVRIPGAFPRRGGEGRWSSRKRRPATAVPSATPDGTSASPLG